MVGDERTFSGMVVMGWCLRGVSLVRVRTKSWRRLRGGYKVIDSLLLMFINR